MAVSLCQQAQRINAMVGNLLDMARLQSGSVQLRLQWLPVDEVVGAALQALHGALSRHTVRTDLPDPSEQSLVERLIPDFLWIDTEYTARISLDGLDKNKMRVVPGLTSKAMSAASGYAPRAIVAPIVGAVYKKLGGS